MPSPLTPRLELNVAFQALRATLRAQAAELRSLRARLVDAADCERRRVERNIHDAAQHHLVALSLNIRLARTLSATDPERADRLLAELEDTAEEALCALRHITHGACPPLLVARGLGAALTQAADRVRVRVRAEVGAVGRYEPEAEAALYFCALEALQNVVKHGGAAARVELSLREERGTLILTVADDGTGFDPGAQPLGSGLSGMKDRLALVGGALRIESVPGQGTLVTALVPLAATPAARPDTAAPL